MALTNANDLNLAEEMQGNIASVPEDREDVQVASTITLPSTRTPVPVNKTVVKEEEEEDVGIEEIEAIQDPAISELEGATEMDAPMLEKGYYYEQAVEEKKAEKARQGLVPPIVGAPTSPRQILTQSQQNALQAANKTFVEMYKDDLASYGQVFAENVVTGSLEMVPEIGSAAIKALPASVEVAFNITKNIGGRLNNLFVKAIETAFYDEDQSLAHHYMDLPGILDTSYTDELTKSPREKIKKFLTEWAKPLEEKIIREHIGLVDLNKRNWLHDWLGKSGLVAAPLIPMYTGFSMVIQAPKFFFAAKKAGDGLAKAAGKAVTNTALSQTERLAGVLNTALGAGFVWQSAETVGRGTIVEKIAPVLAIPGAVMGASGLARKSMTVPFGIGLAAVGLLVRGGAAITAGTRVSIVGEGASKGMLRMLAMARGVPLKTIFQAKTEEDLMNAINLREDNGAMQYMTDLASGVKSLPLELRQPIIDNFEFAERMIAKYDGKDGEQLTFFLSQITGLGIQGAVAKSLAQSESISLFRPIKKLRQYVGKRALYSEMELQAQVYEKNAKIIKDQFLKIMNQKDGAYPDDEFKEVLEVLSRQLNAYADEAAVLRAEVNIMTDSTAIFRNSETQREIHAVADELFNYNSVFKLDNASSEQILEIADNFKQQIIRLGSSAFEKAKKLNDAAWEELRKHNDPVNAVNIVDFLMDEAAASLRSPLFTAKTKAGRYIPNQTDLIELSRKAALDKFNLDELKKIVQRISADSEGTFGRPLFDARGNTINFDDLAKRIEATQGDTRTQETIYREFLGGLQAPDASLKEVIDALIPPRFYLMDLLKYRSKLLEDYRKYNGNAEGHEIGKLLDVVTEAIDSHAVNIKNPEVKELYDNAIDVYKQRILPWKESLGTEAHRAVFKTEGFEDTLAPEHLFAMFTRMRNPQVMARTFNAMFSDPEDKAEAARLFQLTVGRVLNGDFMGFKGSFISQLDDVQAATMKEAGMITDAQFEGLRRIIQHKDKVLQATKSETLKLEEQRFMNNVFNPFMDKISKGLGESSPLYQELSTIKNSEDLMRVMLTEHIIDIPSLRKGSYEYKGIRERIGQAGPQADTLLKSYDELMDSIPNPAKESVTNQMIKAIGDSPSTAFEKFKSYESLEQLLIHRVYTDSFQLTPKKDLTQVISDMQEQAKNRFVSRESSGLHVNIDLVRMSEILEKAQPAFKALAKAKDSIRKEAGVNEPPHTDTFENLTEIFQIARLSVGEIADVTLGNMGTKMGIASILSRIYGVARGVVSLRYVASDIFIRELHRRKVQYLSEVISNPIAVKTMHDVLVKGKTVTRAQANYWKGAIAILVGKTIADNIDDEDMKIYLQTMFGSWDGKSLPKHKMPRQIVTDPRVLFPAQNQKLGAIDRNLVRKMKGVAEGRE